MNKVTRYDMQEPDDPYVWQDMEESDDGVFVLYGDYERVEKAADKALKLLAELTDDEYCHYDHHGYCQTHYLHEYPCPNERSLELLIENGIRK